MPLFDFSSIYRMYSQDKEHSLNISVYLGTIYLSIFKNKKLIYKLKISQAIYLLLSENLQKFISISKNEDNISLTTNINMYNPTTKSFKDLYRISYIKNVENDKYKPYTLQIEIIDKNLIIDFMISANLNYTTSINNQKPEYADPNFAIRYFNYIFSIKLNDIRPGEKPIMIIKRHWIILVKLFLYFLG